MIKRKFGVNDCMPETQDVILTQQDPVKFIRDAETLEIFKDENLKYVLKFLQMGPMSIADLEDEFRKMGPKYERSDKSIYRYLKELIKKNLVVKGGKRVTNKDGEIKTETIFMRTAIAFITVTPVDDRECAGDETCPVWESVRVLLEEYHEKKIDPKEFANFANKLDKKTDDLIIDLFENAKRETLEKIAKLDYKGVNYVLQFTGWLAMLSETDLDKELKTLLK
jgi:hypothetical protein